MMKYPIKPGVLVTPKSLEEIEACDAEIAVFHKKHPYGLLFTKKNLIRCAKEGFNIRWLANSILTYPPVDEFNDKIYPYFKEWIECECQVCLDVTTDICHTRINLQIESAKLLWELTQDDKNLWNFDCIKE